MKDLLKIFIIQFLFITASQGQVIDVSDWYTSGKYFFPDFELIGGGDDLPHYRISSLMEDHNGYLWIGTRDGGLMCYDGYTFESFEENPSDPFSLSSNDVLFVFEDSRNMLWVGTDNALCYYHPYSKQFIKLKLFDAEDGLMNPRNLSSITEAKNGNLLIGTNIGLIEISDIQLDNFLNQSQAHIDQLAVGISVKQILFQDNDQFNSELAIKDVHFDEDGVLWILTKFDFGMIRYEELYRLPQEASSLNLLYDYQSIVEIQEGLRFFIDSDGLIWVNTEDKLLKINNKNGEIDIEEIDYASRTKEVGNINPVAFKGKTMWIGHESRAMQLFDEATQSFYPLTFKSNISNNLEDQGISCFLRTTSNVLFVGTPWGGLFKFNPNSVFTSSHPNLQSIHLNQTNNLRYVFEDSKGYIWIVSKDIYRCDRNTGEVLATYSSDFFKHKWHYTNKLLEDSKGRFWFGMESRGLSCILFDETDGDSNVGYLRTIHKKLIDNKTVTALHEDDEGTIWVATIHQKADSAKFYTELFRISSKGIVIGEYPLAQSFTRNGNEIDHFVNQIYATENDVWMATGFGLLSFSKGSQQLHHYYLEDLETGTYKGDQLLSIYPDPYLPDDILWIGTANRGLYTFNIKAQQLKTVDIRQDLASNHIASILSDHENKNLWLGTDRGISRLILEDGGGEVSQVFNYRKSDGLVTNDFSNYYGPNAVKTKSGALIFTGPRGFQIIEPQGVKEDSIIPPLHLTGITINYKTADYGQEGSPLTSPISLTKHINLTYDNSTLGFEMTALDFKAPDRLNYAYMLVNYDNDWIYNEVSRSIQYTKLPPGDYELKMKIATREGVWSDAISALTLTVTPPWWNNILAYSFYVLLFLFGVWLVDRFQRSRQKMKMSIQVNQLEADKLRELDLMKSRFFANISHEFKTPLTLIMNPVEDMLAVKEPRPSHDSLLMIKQNANRLQKYINEILELSKLDANRVRLRLRELDLVKYLRYIMASFDSLAKQKNLSMKLESPEKEVICYLDPEKLNTILTNLISNAIKFTPGGGRILLSLSGCFCNTHEHCTQKNGCVTLTVKDTGIGIPESKLPFIFNRYYKIDDTDTSNGSGTGLGLALVRELVQLHRGSINVQSVEGKYTSFQLDFPMGRYHIKADELTNPNRYEIAEEFAETAKVPITAKDEEASDSVDLNVKIVLIIEDNKDMRTLITKGLSMDYKVVQAKDGEEGIAKAIELSPDLILCDVMMPKKDGFEVSRTLKANELTSHIPIIILTAKSQMSDKLEGLDTGADDYLIKPFYAKELKARVSNLLEQRDKLRNKYGRMGNLKLDKLPIKSIDQQFLEKVISIIEKHLSDENFGVPILLQEMGISRTQLHRKLKAVVNQSANELIQNIRMQKASEMLRNKTANIAEVAYLVGFSSPPYFTRLFKQHFGHTPSEHQSQ